jgi:hypothetical protein
MSNFPVKIPLKDGELCNEVRVKFRVMVNDTALWPIVRNVINSVLWSIAYPYYVLWPIAHN